MIPRVLVIAGSDSGGGAGIQADLKTVMAMGGYATTAVTALTVQNTLGVTGIMAVPADFIRRQIEAVLDDIGADAVKTGMLTDRTTIEAVASALPATGGLKLVVDPVMVAKGGAALLVPSAVDAIRTLLAPRATVLTPNLPEAEALLGRPIASVDAMREAAADLLALGARAVVVKGGHLDGPIVYDVLAFSGKLIVIPAERIVTRHSHGTGCTFASAIAVGLGRAESIETAVRAAHDFVHCALRAAPGFGRGHGPLGHGFAWTRDGEGG